VTTLNYLPHDQEVNMSPPRRRKYDNDEGRKIVSAMVALADLSRAGFIAGDISPSCRRATVITWAEMPYFGGDVGFAFRLTSSTSATNGRRATLAEYYQRCFGKELPSAAARAPASLKKTAALTRGPHGQGFDPLEEFRRVTRHHLRRCRARM